MQDKKEISTIAGALIIIVASIILFSGAIAYLNIELNKIISIFLDTNSIASLSK